MFLFHKPSEDIEFNYDSEYGYLSFRFLLNKKSIILMSCEILDDKIHISDIKPYDGSKRTKYFNKGYGSKLMNALLDYCKENGVSEIYGELSIVDLDHKDRLHHFYQKFGFDIVVFPCLMNCYYGSILKKLQTHL